MLAELSVKNLALIENESLSLGPGLNILTGETGAGKSLIAGAITLLLGGRASAGLIREGAAEAEVTALFELSRPEDMAPLFAAVGLEPQEQLVARRLINRSGRGRSYLNGVLVTLSQLGLITRNLLSISSQHEQQSLLDPAQQLDYLDNFGSYAELLEAMGTHWRAYHQSRQKYGQVLASVRETREKAEFYEFQLREIESVNPKSGEDDVLAEELARIQSGAKIKEAVKAAYDFLYAEKGAALERLDKARQFLARAAGFDAQGLEGQVERLENAFQDLNELAFELSSYLGHLDLDPQRLDELEERLDALHKLKRKHGGALAEVLAKAEKLKARLRLLEDGEAELGFLKKDCRESWARALETARALSHKRSQAAARLSEELTEVLKPLGLPNIEFKVVLLPPAGPDEKLGPLGYDQVSFEFSSNLGESLKPLAKVASGGELSRVMLGLKSLTVGRQPDLTVIFDEIDAGLGGAAADKVALKLNRLAAVQQLICITHLPQIAAGPGEHFLVHKADLNGRTITRLTKLKPGARVEELARMMVGENPTGEALAVVRQMMDDFRADRQPFQQ